MSDVYFLLTLAFSLSHYVAQGSATVPDCANNTESGRTLRVSVNSERSQTGEWVDTFASQAEFSNDSYGTGLDLTHRITECSGRRIVYIKGVTKDATIGHGQGKILFHPKCGKNIAVINNGRSVQKINLADPINAVVLTDRPLKDDEIFEVKLDVRTKKSGSAIGIGISICSPSEIDIPAQMYKTPCSWMMHHTNIYANGSEIITRYGNNLNELKAGDTVGVMRSRFGALHFFINGVDQGPAASNLPRPVYGVFELYYDAVKATIVDKSSPSEL